MQTSLFDLESLPLPVEMIIDKSWWHEIMWRVTRVKKVRGEPGAPEPRGQRGQLPPLSKQCGGSTGATGCPFYRNCTSKFVRYSQELEFITIFRQCLSNLCLIFNQL